MERLKQEGQASDLSKDELLSVFEHLDPMALDSCSRVCAEWREVAKHPMLWTKIVEQAPLVVPKDCRNDPWDVYALHRRWLMGKCSRAVVPSLDITPTAICLDGDVLHAVQSEPAASCTVDLVDKKVSSFAQLGHRKTACCGLAPDGCSAFSYKRDSFEFNEDPTLVLVYNKQGDVVNAYADRILKRNNVQAVGIGRDGRIAFGLQIGSLCLACTRGSNVSKVDFARHGEPPMWSVDATNSDLCVAGSALGDVVTVDWNTLTVLRRLVGPCNCGVPAVAVVNENMVLGGYAHTQLGNGHRSNVVAWDARAGSRIGSYGREMRGSAYGLPHVLAICGDSVDGRRIAVAYRDRVIVYETRTWACLLEPEIPATDHVTSIAMDFERLIVGLMPSNSSMSCNHDAPGPRGYFLTFEFTPPA
mmetsp:Transcript_2182/g.6492  ORF Transcript_2182/g.6492 Transcript_2182/m.6492 type:complete len:417 (-) Transcript_2182:109-1359(-)